jgi:hypothetical protein
MEGNVRVLPIKRLGSLICVSVALGVVAGACGGASVDAQGSSGHAEGGSGCHTYIRGVLRRILPETSDLSCTTIDDLITGIPSEPGVESILGGSPQLLWKCRFYGEQEAPPLLLRCQHHKRQFSIVKSA